MFVVLLIIISSNFKGCLCIFNKGIDWNEQNTHLLMLNNLEEFLYDTCTFQKQLQEIQTPLS